jgi:predicted O-methyltransferase YrrM
VCPANAELGQFKEALTGTTRSRSFSRAMDLQALLASPPKLHRTYSGELISDWRIDDETSRALYRLIKPGMTTIETGAGLSTILFAAAGCRHTCIMPDQGLADRITAYCNENGISTKLITFLVEKSRDVVPSLRAESFDLALIDGCHGFPSIFVDFCYVASALKIGGTMVVDDMHIYTCLLASLYMREDDGWNVTLATDRVTIGTKVADTIDREWVQQPFVLNRSVGNTLGIRDVAKLALKNLRKGGVRLTAQKILKRIAVRGA